MNIGYCIRVFLLIQILIFFVSTKNRKALIQRLNGLIGIGELKKRDL